MSKYVLWLIGLFIGCQSTSTQEKRALFEGMDRRTKLRFQGYIYNGQKLYHTYCANCHQKTGKGLRKLFPALQNSLALKNSRKVACLIRYGTPKDTFSAQIQFMPAHLSLRPIQIAEIMSYIGNTWGNREGFTSVQEVSKYLDSCKVGHFTHVN